MEAITKTLIEIGLWIKWSEEKHNGLTRIIYKHVHGEEYAVNVIKAKGSTSERFTDASEAQEYAKKEVRRAYAARNRRERDQVYKDCGLKKVKGSLGGTYWE